MRYITHHAIEQFIRRWDPNKHYADAKEELETLFRHATITGKTPLGDTIMASGYRPEVRFVVKDRNVAVTVLPPGRIEEVMELYEEELLEREAENVFKIKCMNDEIDLLKKEKASVDEERDKLAKKKSTICNQITTLEKHIKQLEEFKVL